VRHRALRPGIAGAVAIAAVAVLVVVAGSVIYRGTVGASRERRQAELRVIGDLKADEIVDWRDGRVADADLGASWDFGGQAVAAWLAAPGDAALRADLVGRLGLLQGREPAAEHPRYDDAIIATRQGDLLLSVDPSLTDLDAEARRLASEVIASRAPALGDLVRSEPSGDIHIDAAAPILDGSGRPLAVLILRSDPTRYLYEAIQRVPMPGESAETLLVRRDGDSVLFLNVLRNRADPALTLREPLSSPDFPAVAAVLGRVGEFEGRDYRGEAVLADLRPVPDSPWFLVTKIDSREALAEAELLGGSIVVIGLFTLILTVGAVAVTLALRQISLRRRLLRSEQRRASSAHLYERVLVLARDPFLLEDASGQIVDANAAAVATYGYSREELLRLHVIDLRSPETHAVLDQDWQAAASPDGALFETVHVRKDGSTFPVEVSSRAIDVNGVPHHQSFIRDISPRRAAEAQLRRRNAAYATLAQTNETILRVRDEATLFASICRIAVELGGYLGAWVGIAEPSSKRIVPVASAGSIDDFIRELRISTDPSRPEGRGPMALAFRDGRPCYSDEFLDLPATLPGYDHAPRVGLRASAALPLLRGGVPAAVLALYAGEPHVFDGQMRALLEEMAADVSFALDTFDRDAALAASQAELARQLFELRRWNEATLGREERVLDLKGEVNDLLARLGEPPRYPSATDDADATDG
jgi:PAS domain S-box-containing protein